MVRRTYKKPHRAKRKKTLWQKPVFWRSLVLATGAGGAVWLVCFSPALEVKEIEVAGTQKIDNGVCAKMIEEEVAKKIALFDSKSILLFDLEQAKKDLLARFPQAQDIKIERQFPSKIIASVQERRAVAIFNGNDKRWLLDNDGIAFEESTVGESNDLLQIFIPEKQAQIGQQIIDKNTLSGILRIKGEIGQLPDIVAESISLATPERINLLTKEGWYVYFNPLKDIDQQLAKLAAVAKDEEFLQKRKNLEYVDVRFTRVYLKEKIEN
jgi:cell division septal protein FtsQ